MIRHRDTEDAETAVKGLTRPTLFQTAAQQRSPTGSRVRSPAMSDARALRTGRSCALFPARTVTFPHIWLPE
jgi:hypothetical protein